MTMSLLWRPLIFLILLAAESQASDNTKNCALISKSEKERKLLRVLEPLTKQNFTVKEQNYTYVFQVCGDAGGFKNAGMVQKEKQGKNVVIGKYSSTEIVGGSDWVMLIYQDGERYDSHCSKEPRKAFIMISCNRDVVAGKLSVVVENNERDTNCFYLFEMDSSAVCPAIKSKLSAGSIVLIVGFSCLAVYLIGGFLYQRLVVGAKGVEQFPNYAFWSEIGNLSADGCDFVCRSRGNREEQPTYRGVATEPLEEPEERDDHLLPM